MYVCGRTDFNHHLVKFRFISFPTIQTNKQIKKMKFKPKVVDVNC